MFGDLKEDFPFIETELRECLNKSIEVCLFTKGNWNSYWKVKSKQALPAIALAFIDKAHNIGAACDLRSAYAPPLVGAIRRSSPPFSGLATPIRVEKAVKHPRGPQGGGD
jgi:hypothetical protein